MKFSPLQRTLHYLSTHGPSNVQAEAIEILGQSDLPECFPSFPRWSRESLLRRLSENSKKSARVRLEALKDLLAILAHR